MVVKVQLEGLNIVKARGRWYVYFRDGGALIKGFEGTREDLINRIAEPDMLGAYNGRRKRDLSRVYPEGSLGSLVAWFKNDCPRWEKLSDATRKDYEAAYEWLRPEWDCPLEAITTPSLYAVRDRCAKEKWPRFADKMISALSSMFSQGVKRNKLLANPCLGMDKAHAADPNANREWFLHEWSFVRNNAPREVLIPCMIARYAGLAGQTIVGLSDRQFFDHPTTGKAVQYTRRKNGKPTLLPVMVELQDFMGARDIRRADGIIAIREDGSLWENETDMQTRVSHWLRDQERAGHIGAGTTLHGLRVSYAAWWKRNGASNSEVAGLIGDKSEAMGAHYTRHVESEVNVIRAFERVKDKK